MSNITTGAGLKDFIQNPDSYYLHVEKDKKTGSMTICADKRGVITWLKAHLFPAAYKLHEVADIVRSADNLSDFSPDFIASLNGRIEKYNSLHTDQIAELSTKNVSSYEVTPNKSEVSSHEATPNKSEIEFIDQTFPYLNGWLFNLKKLIKGNDLDPNLVRYIRGELAGIEKLVARKKNDEAKQFEQFRDDPLYKKAAKVLSTGFDTILKRVSELKKKLGPEEISSGIVRETGIENVGNSCYMNSALQMLFGSPLIVKRIESYTVPENLPSELAFMPALKEFLNAYKQYTNHPIPKAAAYIGRCASDLREQLFLSRLNKWGVIELRDMADADLVVMVLGEVLNLNYTFITRRVGMSGKTAEGVDIQEKIERDTTNDNQLIWPEIKTSGSFAERSLQQEFDQQCVEASHDTNLGWKPEMNDGRQVTVDEVKTCYRLQGKPPELLIFKVGFSKGFGMDAPFKPYEVGPRDEIFDASKAFDEPPRGGAKYRLIGISENHDRGHWTSKTRRNDFWYDCNDPTITRLGQKVPSAKAAIMVYERIR